MRCLIAAILILVTVIAAFVAGWIWYRWWGLFGAGAALVALAWLVTEFGPRILDRVLVDMVRIEVHSVQLAEESDAAPAMLRQLDGWIREFNEESDEHGFDIDVSEFLSHNEERPDLARYYVEITAGPPEGKPDAKWSPHGIGLKPVGSDDLSGSELYDVQRFDTESESFQPFLDHAFEEGGGEHRLRLHIGLDPTVQRYEFEYACVNRIETAIEIPTPDWSQSPTRRLLLGMMERLGNYQPLKSLNLNWLELEDDDLDRIVICNELEFLGLDGTRITNAGIRKLAPLQRLETLCLCETAIDDDGIDHLIAFPALKTLHIRKSGITKTGVAQLREANPTMKIYR